MDSVRVIVDGLFEEMVGQVKEMLLPPKEESSGGDHQMKKKQKRNSPVKVNSPKKSPTKQNGSFSKPSSPKRPALVFAVKSKPTAPSNSGPSTSAAVSVAAPKRVLILSENSSSSSSTPSPSKQSYKKVKFSSSEHYLDVKFEGENETASEKHFFENPASLKTTHDESNDDGEDDHLSSIENPQNEKPENSQPKQQQQQRQQTVISGQKKSVVVTCPEEGCGKQLQSGNLKRHLKSHAKLKPYGCTYEQCSYETEHRHDALRHIKSVHLAKKKKKKSENGENEDEEEEEDPVAYLSVKQDLL